MATIIDIKKIPQEIRKLNQWVVWRAKPKSNGKTDKPLYDPKSGNAASHSNPENWANFETAVRASEADEYSGIGFVFSQDDPFCGIDLDSKPEKSIKCRDRETRKIEPWAEEIIKNLNSYTEISPSGEGIHIIVKGQLPEGGRKKGQIEVYDNQRFFTVTGQHLENTPQDIRPAQDAINALLANHFKKEVVVTSLTSLLFTTSRSERRGTHSEGSQCRERPQVLPALSGPVGRSWLSLTVGGRSSPL